ncbi:hypothetical protein P279_23945 [Rhodobacteraceae bacterium PD-2]|nr:hypothetical protein P279_23945 [Rhodobacteraceae bacterium PD-2]
MIPRFAQWRWIVQRRLGPPQRVRRVAVQIVPDLVEAGATANAPGLDPLFFFKTQLFLCRPLVGLVEIKPFKPEPKVRVQHKAVGPEPVLGAGLGRICLRQPDR